MMISINQYLKRHWWVIWYVVDACDFVSCPNPWFLRLILVFIRQCLRVILQIVLFLLWSSLMSSYHWALSRLCIRGGGGRGAKIGWGVDLNEWVCAGMRDAILAQNIYGAKPNPKPDNQSGHQFRKRLGYWSPQRNREYNPTTAIATRPLIQTLMSKMVLSIFVAMTRLKVENITSDPLTIIPST